MFASPFLQPAGDGNEQNEDLPQTVFLQIAVALTSIAQMSFYSRCWSALAAVVVAFSDV